MQDRSQWSVVQCQSAQSASILARENHLTAAIVHRAIGTPGVEVVRGIRERSPRVPIIMVSGLDRRAEALAAGADRFVPFDEWPQIHTILEDASIARETNLSAGRPTPVRSGGRHGP